MQLFQARGTKNLRTKGEECSSMPEKRGGNGGERNQKGRACSTKRGERCIEMLQSAIATGALTACSLMQPKHIVN